MTHGASACESPANALRAPCEASRMERIRADMKHSMPLTLPCLRSKGAYSEASIETCYHGTHGRSKGPTHGLRTASPSGAADQTDTQSGNTRGPGETRKFSVSWSCSVRTAQKITVRSYSRWSIGGKKDVRS